MLVRRSSRQKRTGVATGGGLITNLWWICQCLSAVEGQSAGAGGERDEAYRRDEESGSHCSAIASATSPRSPNQRIPNAVAGWSAVRLRCSGRGDPAVRLWLAEDEVVALSWQYSGANMSALLRRFGLGAHCSSSWAATRF